MEFSQHQYHIMYLFYLIGFILIFFTASLSLWRLHRCGQHTNNRGLVHLFLILATVAGALDMGSKLYPHTHHKVYALCYFPYTLTWYFLFTAYILALFRWIVAYRIATIGAANMRLLPVARAASVVFDVVLLAVLLLAASEFCSEDRNSARRLSSGDLIYVGTIVVTALLMAGLFFFYGWNIARRLKKGMALQLQHRDRASYKRDKVLYVMTVQTCIVSLTTVVGALLAGGFAVLTTMNPLFNSMAHLVQVIFKYIGILQMLYMLRPKPNTRKKNQLRGTEMHFLRTSSSSVGVSSAETSPPLSGDSTPEPERKYDSIDSP